MREQEAQSEITPRYLLLAIDPLKKKAAWQDIVELAVHIPKPMTAEWCEAADEVAFALGQLDETDRAVALLEAAYELSPTHRRASALAYLYYDALLGQRGKRSGPERDRDADRRGFLHWIETALTHDGESIKDLYRLGVFEAQVEHQRDGAALRAFLHARGAYRRLDEETKARRGDLRKYHAKTLYAGARSALRLKNLQRAREMIFECLRVDKDTDHVEGVFKLFLAGKVCFAIAQSLESSDDEAERAAELKWLDHAERAFRQALDASGPRGRDFVFAKLAELALWNERLEDAFKWIDDNIPPHRRKPVVWRLLGNIHRAGSRPQEAILAYQNALQRDRAGRHLTLTELGFVQLELGKLKEAERSFRKANDFRRRRYLSEHRDALEGLIAALEQRGKTEQAAEVRAELDESRRHAGERGSHGRESERQPRGCAASGG